MLTTVSRRRSHKGRYTARRRASSMDSNSRRTTSETLEWLLRNKASGRSRPRQEPHIRCCPRSREELLHFNGTLVDNLSRSSTSIRNPSPDLLSFGQAIFLHQDKVSQNHLVENVLFSYFAITDFPKFARSSTKASWRPKNASIIYLPLHRPTLSAS